MLVDVLLCIFNPLFAFLAENPSEIIQQSNKIGQICHLLLEFVISWKYFLFRTRKIMQKMLTLILFITVYCYRSHFSLPSKHAMLATGCIAGTSIPNKEEVLICLPVI
jgi:hypothetical protein